VLAAMLEKEEGKKHKNATNMKKSARSVLEHLYTAIIMHEGLPPPQECLKIITLS
jgi:hypothetical protein